MENTIDRWDPPKNSAIQIAAAITACARIYMYSYTSREDCYYTDTDFVVLGNPLPEAVKGPAKEHVDAEWFESQYEQPERLLEVDVHSNFRVNLIAFDVYKSREIALECEESRFIMRKGFAQFPLRAGLLLLPPMLRPFPKRQAQSPKIAFKGKSVEDQPEKVPYSICVGSKSDVARLRFEELSLSRRRKARSKVMEAKLWSILVHKPYVLKLSELAKGQSTKTIEGGGPKTRGCEAKRLSGANREFQRLPANRRPDILTSCWNKPVGGCKMFQVWSKLKEVKAGIKQLHTTHYAGAKSSVDQVISWLQKGIAELFGSMVGKLSSLERIDREGKNHIVKVFFQIKGRKPREDVLQKLFDGLRLKTASSQKLWQIVQILDHLLSEEALRGTMAIRISRRSNTYDARNNRLTS
ncbi:DNA polymerase [Bienertia sinuspersici]